MTDGKIRKFQISGRELFLCDNVVDQGLVTHVGIAVKQMHFLRKEKSRPDVPARSCYEERLTIAYKLASSGGI